MAEAPHCRLLPGIILLSLHKPLDIAEQVATLDVMSGGRMIFGAGLGYREVEFKGFGTTQAERVARLEENLEAVVRLWTEDGVTMAGSHFTLDDATVSLKPMQKAAPADLARRQRGCGSRARGPARRHLVHQSRTSAWRRPSGNLRSTAARLTRRAGPSPRNYR